MLPPGYPWIPSKNVSPFIQSRLIGYRNIYTNVVFYYIDECKFSLLSNKQMNPWPHRLKTNLKFSDQMEMNEDFSHLTHYNRPPHSLN